MALAEGEQKGESPVLSSKPCDIPPRLEWNDSEKWVWQQICEEKVADFNTLYGNNDPLKSVGWTKHREITSKFIETILLHEPYRSALSRQGVSISGALFKDNVVLKYARLSHRLGLVNSRFDSDIDLSEIRSSSSISLKGSVFTHDVNISNSKLNGYIDMSDVDIAGSLNSQRLKSAKCSWITPSYTK
jgi:hypothetical protein